MRLIENWWQKMWRLYSVRLNALGLLVLGWIQFDPVSALGVWNMLPGPVASRLPDGFETAIGGALFALSMMARLVHQPKLAAACADQSDA